MWRQRQHRNTNRTRMYLIRQRLSKYVQNSYISNLTIYTNLVYKIWVGVGKGIVIDYFKLEFERIGRLNKVTLGIIELMMNPVDEVHMEELSTEERIIELSVIIWRLTKQRHCNRSIHTQNLNQVGQLNKVTLGIIELMMNPGDEGLQTVMQNIN